MSDENPKTAANPESDQRDVRTQPHPKTPSEREFFLPDEPIPAKDKEPKSGTQMERDNTQGTENLYHVNVNITSPTETRDLSESSQDQPEATAEDAKSNVWAASHSVSVIRTSFSEPSNICCDKDRDISGSLNRNKYQSESGGDFVIAGDQERRTAIETANSNVHNQSDTIQEIRNEIKVSPTTSNKCLHREDHEGNRGVSPAVEKVSQPVTTEEFIEKVRNPFTKSRGDASHDETTTNSDDQNSKEIHREHRDDADTGLMNVRLEPPPSHTKRGSNVQPTSAEENRGVGRSMAIRYQKPTGTNKQCDPSPSNSENRDIFEAGGEELLNPRSDYVSGVLHKGGDEIEYLSEESPEPRIFIDSTPSELEASTRWGDRLVAAFRRRKGCCQVFRERCEEQFAKAPTFYVLSWVTIIVCAIAAAESEKDRDIHIGVILALLICCGVTLGIPRGVSTKRMEKFEESRFFSFFRKSCEKILPGTCSACCRTPEPKIKRHSQYYHTLKEETDTTFEHEVADVSNIDPEDCPQMRIVEEETMESVSPDILPDFSNVPVDVHAQGTSKNSEEVGAIPKAFCTKSAKSRRSTESSSAAQLAKSHKAELPFPGTSRDSYGGDRRTNAAGSGYLQASDIEALKNRLQALCGPPSMATDTSGIEVLDVENDPEEFMCEHHGQGLACSCSLHIPLKK